MQATDPSALQITRPAPGKLHIALKSHPATLAPLRKAFEAFTQQAGFDDAARGEIILVVNEAVANCMRHAYDNATDQPIEINAADDGDKIKITIRDWGHGGSPDLTRKEKDPHEPGGLGLICLRQFMSDVLFTPEPDGMTLTLVRKKDAPK